MEKHPLQPYWTEKAKVAMREKAESGVMPGCAPVGYLNEEKNGEKSIEVDLQTAHLVKALFSFVTKGYSLRKAGQEAHELGLRSRTGKPLGPSSIHGILTNPFYVGMLRYEGKFIQGRHKPLVSKELFERVQEKLGRKK